MRFTRIGLVRLWGRMASCARVANPRRLRRLPIGAPDTYTLTYYVANLPRMLAAFLVLLVPAFAAPHVHPHEAEPFRY